MQASDNVVNLVASLCVPHHLEVWTKICRFFRFVHAYENLLHWEIQLSHLGAVFDRTLLFLMKRETFLRLQSTKFSLLGRKFCFLTNFINLGDAADSSDIGLAFEWMLLIFFMNFFLSIIFSFLLSSSLSDPFSSALSRCYLNWFVFSGRHYEG